MALSSHQSLSIIVIVFFVPAFLASIKVCIRHGFRLQNFWIYMLVLAFLRVLGASFQIASEATASRGLATTAKFMASMGIVPLLLVMLGIIQNVKNTSVRPDPIPKISWTILSIAQWASFILGVVASSTGSHTLFKATIIIIVFCFTIQASISVIFLVFQGNFGCDRRLIMSTPMSIPFLAVRVIYGVLCAFKASSVFGGSYPNVFVLAFMQYLMEFIVVTLFLAVGLSSSVLEPPTKKVPTEEAGNSQSYAHLP